MSSASVIPGLGSAKVGEDPQGFSPAGLGRIHVMSTLERQTEGVQGHALKPAVADLPMDCQGLPVTVDRVVEAMEATVGFAKIVEGQTLHPAHPDLLMDCQGLPVTVDSLFEAVQPTVGLAKIVERPALAPAVLYLAVKSHCQELWMEFLDYAATSS